MSSEVAEQNYRLPSNTCLQHSWKLAIVEDKEIKYWNPVFAEDKIKTCFEDMEFKSILKDDYFVQFKEIYVNLEKTIIIFYLLFICSVIIGIFNYRFDDYFYYSFVVL